VCACVYVYVWVGACCVLGARGFAGHSVCACVYVCVWVGAYRVLGAWGSAGHRSDEFI